MVGTRMTLKSLKPFFMLCLNLCMVATHFPYDLEEFKIIFHAVFEFMYGWCLFPYGIEEFKNLFLAVFEFMYGWYLCPYDLEELKNLYFVPEFMFGQYPFSI